MAACGKCGGLGGIVTVGGWVQCGDCNGSGTRFLPLLGAS